MDGDDDHENQLTEALLERKYNINKNDIKSAKICMILIAKRQNIIMNSIP
jgi:hypothetical protein